MQLYKISEKIAIVTLKKISFFVKNIYSIISLLMI
jgi:hypothetical protein